MGKKRCKKGGCHWRCDGCRARERNSVISRQFWQQALVLGLHHIHSFLQLLSCQGSSYYILDIFENWVISRQFWQKELVLAPDHIHSFIQFSCYGWMCFKKCINMGNFKAILTALALDHIQSFTKLDFSCWCNCRCQACMQLSIVLFRLLRDWKLLSFYESCCSDASTQLCSSMAKAV